MKSNLVESLCLQKHLEEKDMTFGANENDDTSEIYLIAELQNELGEKDMEIEELKIRIIDLENQAGYYK